MLAGLGGVDGHLRVQPIRRRDPDQFDVAIDQEVAIIGVHAGDAVTLRELRRVAFGRGSDRDDLDFIGNGFCRARDAVRLKT